MSSNTPVRLSRICPTLALLVGLGGAAFAAQDIDVTVGVSSTGQTQGGVLVSSSGTVTYTVTFSEDVFPGSLLPYQLLNVTPALGSGLFGSLLTLGGDAAVTNTSIKQVTGRQFLVQVAGLTDGQTASLAIAADKMYDAAAGTDTNKAVAAKVVRFMDMADDYSVSISNADYTGFLSAPTLVGDFSDVDPAAFGTNPLYPDYVVKISEGATAIGNAYTAADGAWFFTPTVALSQAIGAFTLTATPADAAGNVSPNTATKPFYVWNSPTITGIEQSPGDDPATVAFTNLMQVNETKPAMRGLAGLPKTLTGGGVVQVTVDIFDTGTTNPAVAQIVKSGASITAGATAGVDSAIWTIADTDYSTDLVNGDTYDIVVTLRVITTNASTNSISTTKTFTVNTGTAEKPALSVAASTANHFPEITIADGGTQAEALVASTETIQMYVKKNAGAFAATAGTVTAGKWTPDVALTDGSYTFKATWKNTAGKVSPESAEVVSVITTPTPVLSAVVQPTAGGAVSGTASVVDGNVQYLLTNLTPKIAVGGGLDDADGDLVVYRLDRGTNGTDTATPYTIDYTAIDGVITPGASPGTVIPGTLVAGVWTPDTAFTAGRYSLYAKWIDNKDANGTGTAKTDAVSVASNVFNMRILPSVAPPEFTGVNLANLVPNALPTNFIVTTSSGSIVLGGTGNPGATLKLKVGPNATSMNSLPHKIIGTDGTWTYEFSTDGDKNADPLASGTNLVTATQLDLSGTESAVTTKTLTVNVIGSAPQSPNISSPVNLAKVADTTPELKGTAPNNTTVSIYKATKQTISLASDDIVLTARSPKAATITLVDPPGNNASLTVAVSGTDITVTLATDGSSAITSTASQVVSAINGSAAAAALVRAALATGDPGTGLATAVASTAIAASSMVGEVAVGSSGTWTKSLGTLKDGTTATTPATLAAGAEPGTLYTLFATATSASGIEGASSGTIDLYVVTPVMSVALAAIAKGTGTDYTMSANAAKGATSVKVISAALNGTILVGDTIRLADTTVSSPDIADATTDYKVTAVVKTASAPDAYTLTISPGLKEAHVSTNTMTIQANPNGPTSGKSSLSSILLTATFTNGGAVDEIVAADFTKDDFAITNGTISSITKGTGLVGQQPTNVWTIAVAPSVTEGANLTVQVKEAAVPTKPGYILSGFEATNVGSNYTPANTTLTVGGGSAASITWTDNGDGGGTAADGKIQAGELDIVDPGYGFTAAAASITVTGGPGSGAVVPTSIPFTTGAGFTTGVHALTTQGNNYISGVAKVAFIGGGTPTTPAAATATVVAGKVTSINITTAGTGYTSRPTIQITSGSGAVLKGLTTAGTVVFNSASNTYTQAIDRIKPVVTWKGAADTSEQLFNVAVSGSPATNAAITGLTYVNLVNPASDTQFKVRAHFSSPMSRELVAGDLQVAGATVLGVTDVDGLTDNSAGDTNQDFDILLKRGSSAATAMTVTVKAMADLKDDTTPAQPNVASPLFSATVVGQPTAPVLASTVGALAPLVPSRTGSYPCTVKFTAPVTGFTAQSLSVTNGVIAKFSGTGSTYNFTLVPGEGQVSVLYDSTLNPILDVAGNAIPSSNTLIRVLDSTQTLVSSVSSPAFQVSGAIKPQNGGAAYNKVAMRVTFSEAPKSFPSSAVFATLASNGSVIGLVAPAGSPVGATGPQPVDLSGKTWGFDLVIPSTGTGSVNLVLPALLVPDQAGNQSAASQVYTIDYDHTAGTAVEMVVSPNFSG